MVRHLLKPLVHDGYTFSFAGHSLGAGLAELGACHFNLPAVTFDSPGTSGMINMSAMEEPCFRHKTGQPPFPATFKLKTYLSAPSNYIHRAEGHFGKIFQSNQISVSSLRVLYYFAMAVLLYIVWKATKFGLLAQLSLLLCVWVIELLLCIVLFHPIGSFVNNFTQINPSIEELVSVDQDAWDCHSVLLTAISMSATWTVVKLAFRLG